MKKKLLSAIFLIVAICLSISIGTGVNYASAESESVQAINVEYFANSNRSVAIYNEAISPYKSISIKYNGDEVVSYSEDFAGIFIDDEGFLNIGLVGSQHSVSNFNGQVIYKQYIFSYNYLQEIQNVVTDIMTDYNIHLVGIDEKSNNVSIYLNDECDIEKLSNFLQVTKGFDEKALNFIVDGSGGIIQNSTAYGGESISRRIDATTISRGTICVNAIDNTTGQLGILTNEHVALAAQNPSPLMSYRGHFDPTSVSFSENISLGNGARGQHTGDIDAAFVPFTNQQNWEITPYGKYDTTPYTNVRLGNNNQIIQGRAIRKIGQTSGVTDGTILM